MTMTQESTLKVEAVNRPPRYFSERKSNQIHIKHHKSKRTLSRYIRSPKLLSIGIFISTQRSFLNLFAIMEKEHEHNENKDNNDDIENDGSSCIEVTDMINKAKRTAGSLWMILHAQCCQNPSCLVIGCSQTRELLSHVKTCPAGPGFDCPQCVNGCSQARKLLTHYRHCRDMRNRRVNNANNGRSVKTTGHACLICTLAARHEPKRMEVKPRPLANTSRLSRISLSKIKE